MRAVKIYDFAITHKKKDVVSDKAVLRPSENNKVRLRGSQEVKLKTHNQSGLTRQYVAKIDAYCGFIQKVVLKKKQAIYY